VVTGVDATKSCFLKTCANTATCGDLCRAFDYSGGACQPDTNLCCCIKED